MIANQIRLISSENIRNQIQKEEIDKIIQLQKSKQSEL